MRLANGLPSRTHDVRLRGRLNGIAAVGAATLAPAGYAGFVVGPVLIGTAANAPGSVPP